MGGLDGARPKELYAPREVIGELPAGVLVVCTPAMDQATPIENPQPPNLGRLMALAERHGIENHGVPEGPAEFGRRRIKQHDRTPERRE